MTKALHLRLRKLESVSRPVLLRSWIRTDEEGRVEIARRTGTERPEGQGWERDQ